MNYGRYFMPNMWANNMIRMNPNFYYYPHSFWAKAINSIKNFNWGGLLSGANKTLNVVNQSIPLVKQAKPMFNNIRSMVNVMREFGKETSVNNNHVNAVIKDNIKVPKKEVLDNNYPNFFV